jgi:hypothetical protein
VACFSAACFIRNLQRIPGDLSSFELQHALGLVLHDGGGRIDLIPVTPTPHPEGDGAAASALAVDAQVEPGDRSHPTLHLHGDHVALRSPCA